MGKILEFRRPDPLADDIEKLLRELFEPERELDREVDPGDRPSGEADS